jgi:hypothetical protein
MYQITLNLIAWAFLVGFFAGLGWALAHWLVNRLLVRV